MMFFINSIEPYTPPESSRIHFLKGIELQNPLIYDEIMEISNSSYSNQNWSRLSYFVMKNSLNPYNNQDIGRIVDRKISKGEWEINERSVNCIFYETYLRMPSVCDWTHQFMFFTPDNLLGSLGIYSLQLSADTSEYMALYQIAKVPQFQLLSNSPFKHFMVAIQKGDRWEIALGEVLPVFTPKKYTNARKVKITLFKEPSKFFQEILKGGKVSNLIYDEYEFSVRVQY